MRLFMCTGISDVLPSARPCVQRHVKQPPDRRSKPQCWCCGSTRAPRAPGRILAWAFFIIVSWAAIIPRLARSVTSAACFCEPARHGRDVDRACDGAGAGGRGEHPDRPDLVGTRVAVIADGGLRAVGAPEEVVTAEMLSAIYRTAVIVEDTPSGRRVCVPAWGRVA